MICEECGKECASGGSLRLHLLDHGVRGEARRDPGSSVAPSPTATPPTATPPPPDHAHGHGHEIPARSDLSPAKAVLLVAGGILVLIAVLVGVVTFLGRSSESTPEAAVPVESPEGRFRAEFPGTPKARDLTVQSPLGPLKITYHESIGSDYSFSVGYVDYPAPVRPEDAGAVLDATANGAASEIGGTVTLKTPTTVVGSPAIDYVFTGKNEGQSLEGRARGILVGQRLYVLQGITRPGAHRAPYDHLLATFALLPA